MGGWLIDATRGVEKPLENLVKRSAKTIETSLLVFARRRCIETHTDWNFFHAVLLYENLQRPPWVRKTERLTQRIRKQGTYGIMQTKSAKALSDEDSVDVALRDFFGGFQIGQDPWTEIVEKLTVFNGDPAYGHQVYQIYELIKS
jgi:hypothetical protein